MLTKRIFLDSRDWITLAKVKTGKENDPILQEVYRKIIDLSNNEKAIFPFSMFHLDDLMKNSNKKQRHDVTDMIIEISKGWVMKPFLLFREMETVNAILHRYGLNSLHDVRSKIIGKGVAYLAGIEYHVTSSNPKVQKFLNDHEQELRDKADSIESMRKILEIDDTSHFKKEYKMYITLADKLENNRKVRSNWTKSQRYDNELGAYFTNSIIPAVSEFFKKNGHLLKPMTLFETKEDVKSFLEDMPSSNVFVHLLFARDEESPQRKVQPNDMIDINHLAGAIPYCDIVVMEKMFTNLCIKQKLHKKYDCILLSSLKELNKVLDTL